MSRDFYLQNTDTLNFKRFQRFIKVNWEDINVREFNAYEKPCNVMYKMSQNLRIISRG